MQFISFDKTFSSIMMLLYLKSPRLNLVESYGVHSFSTSTLLGRHEGNVEEEYQCLLRLVFATPPIPFPKWLVFKYPNVHSTLQKANEAMAPLALPPEPPPPPPRAPTELPVPPLPPLVGRREAVECWLPAS